MVHKNKYQKYHLSKSKTKSKTYKFKTHKSKRKLKQKSIRKLKQSKKNIVGGYYTCNDKIITEPGFNIPVYGKASGLNIKESKVFLNSSNQFKINHPAIIN